jgi:hypothetical protein
VQRFGAGGVEAPADAGADGGVRRRAQLQVGQSGLEVEAGAADDDRPAAGGEGRVDLGPSALGELAGGERLARVEEGQQPVLELRLLRGRGGAGERLEAAVDLEGVGGDRHRILPALAQPLGERDRHPRLPDPGGAEQCHHVHGR